MLKDALRLNPEIRILGSPWSAPAWMKTNGKLTGISEADKAAGATCKLKPECFEAYADYFVKFIEQYQAEGIEIWGVTLQNEPQFDAAAYPCMRMNEDDQIRLVSLLGPKLAAKGLKTKIFVHDHNWGLHPGDRKVIGGDAKMDPVESVTKIFSDPTAGKYIAGSAWHCYYGDANLMRKTYNTIHQRFPDKEILCTEHGGWGRKRGDWWGDVDWGMAHSWMGGPQNWCQASVEWNLALNGKFGPTPRPDSEAAGLVVIQTDNYQEVKFEREFYAHGPDVPRRPARLEAHRGFLQRRRPRRHGHHRLRPAQRPDLAGRFQQEPNGTVIPSRGGRQILRLPRTRTQHRHVRMVITERQSGE